MKTKKTYNHWTEDMDQAISDFDLIKPILERYGFTNIINLEAHLTNHHYELDIIYGCDILATLDGKEIGIASRIQRGYDYNSFSLRDKRHTGTKTEIDKRLDEIKRNDLKAIYTLQGFIENDVVIKMGLCKTVDLYDLFENKNGLFGYRYSDNAFYYINFDVYKKFKPILIYKK